MALQYIYIATELVGLGVLYIGVSLVITVLVGTIVLLVSTAYVRDIEARIYENSVRAGAIGVGALFGGVIATLLVMIMVSFSVEPGTPSAIGVALLILVFGGSVFVFLFDAIGTIVAGSYVLRRRAGMDPPNHWLALLVGAVVIQVLALVPLVNVLVLLAVFALPAGAMIDRAFIE